MICNSEKKGLYIHIPFCIRKCPYCDFYSVKANEALIKRYEAAVIRNIGAYLEKDRSLCFDTIYFGGGTPSLLPAESVRNILSAVGERMDGDSEVTLEMNPKTADAGYLNELHSAGVNRLSIGVQSCIDSELSGLGRLHSASQALDTVAMAKQSGFENISCDLMIGIQGQNAGTMLESLEILSGTGIQHISAYMLKIEQGTPFYADKIYEIVPDEDETADMYLAMVDFLEKKDFKQYEISNFALKGFESRHNLKYWHCEEYVGIGAAAHSFYKGKRYAVPRDVEAFVNAEVQEEYVTEDKPADFEERAMLQLRLSEGLCPSDFPEHEHEIVKKAASLEKAGLLEISGGKIRLTPKGFLLSNTIIEKLILSNR